MDGKRLFVFGLGDSARRLAGRAGTRDYHVGGTVRTADKARTFTAQGHEAMCFERTTPLSDPASLFAGVTHLLSSIPPDPDGDPALAAHGADLQHHARHLQWIGYLSTTGVYGDHGGAWVDEDTPPAPASERAQRRLLAEQQWQALGRRLGVPVHIFRLPGIYGPGRSALDQVRAGNARRIVKPGQVFSRIHVDDIATTVLASMERPGGTQIYNVADDEPAPQAEVVAYACMLLGVAPPPLVDYAEIESDLSPMARSFHAESRRVRNGRIKQELGVRLAYPSYREGLRAILAGGG
jgi:dTDP-4-dehydrorhamnose reductase